MKNRVLAAVLALLLLGIALYLGRQPGTANNLTPGQNPLSQAAAISNALAGQSPRTVALIASNFAGLPPANVQPNPAATAPASAAPPASLQFTNFAAATVVENVRHAIRQYGAMFGGNPVGNNQEITSQLNGNNPKHINFLNAEAGMRLNENGELIDPWGTPYFFHQISGADTEIHSAGPDKIMWTLDDIVAR